MFYLFFVFFTEAVLPQLLYALCSGPETPIEHLERQQVRKKLKLNSNLTPIFTNITPWEQKKEAPCGKLAVEVAVVRKEEMYITPILLRVQRFYLRKKGFPK